MGSSRQGYWSGLPFPPPGDLPSPGIVPASPVPPVLQVDSLPLSHLGSPSGQRITQRKSGPDPCPKCANHLPSTHPRISPSTVPLTSTGAIPLDLSAAHHIDACFKKNIYIYIYIYETQRILEKTQRPCRSM